MGNIKSCGYALVLSFCTLGISAQEVEFADLHASSFEIGATSAEDRNGTRIALDWSISENFAIEVEGFDFNNDSFTLIRAEDIPWSVENGDFRLSGLELTYGVRLQKVFYNLVNRPVSFYASAGNVRINIDEIKNPEDEVNTNDSLDQVEEFIEFSKTDLFYYGAGTTWYLNNRTSLDVSYVIYDRGQRNVDAGADGSLKIGVKYAPVKNFGFAFDYMNEDAFGETRSSISVFVRW